LLLFYKVPKGNHVLNLTADGFDCLYRICYHIRVAKLSGIVAIVSDFVIKDFKLIAYKTKAILGLSYTSLVLVEVTLLHLSSVDFEVLLKLLDKVSGLLVLSVDQRSDLLLNVLCKLLEGRKFIEEFLDLLDLRVLGDPMLLEHL